MTGRAMIGAVVAPCLVLTATIVFAWRQLAKWWGERRELRGDGFDFPWWWSNQRTRMYLVERQIERERDAS